MELNFISKDLLKRFFIPLWKFVILGVFFSLIAMFLEVLLPLISKCFIDYVVLEQKFSENGLFQVFSKIGLSLGSIQSLLFLMVGMGSVIGIATFLENYLLEKMQRLFVFRIQKDLVAHILKCPFPFFREKHSSYLVARISEDVRVLQYFFSDHIVQCITSVLGFIACVVMIFLMNTKLFFIAMGAIPLATGMSYFLAKKSRKVSLEEREKEAKVSQDMQEIFSAIDTVKSYTREEEEAQKIEEKLKGIFFVKKKNSILRILADQSARGILFSATVLITILSVYSIKNGTMTIGDYIAFTAYMMYLTNFSYGIAGCYFKLQGVFVSMKRVMELFAIKQEEKKLLKEPQKEIQGEIWFKNLSFSHGEASIFKNFSLKILPKTTVVLAGESGCGKSTFASLLLKFYFPEKGEIFLDGMDLATLDSGWLRSHIAFVSQDIFLFDDTIAKNIAYGKKEATKEEIEQAAKRAKIHEEILKLPGQYETLVGERGAKLSMGQKQRISLARAFLKSPPILIFDEPTSALDYGTEELFRKSLESLTSHHTILIITHRKLLAGIADRILVLEKGQTSKEIFSSEKETLSSEEKMEKFQNLY